MCQTSDYISPPRFLSPYGSISSAHENNEAATKAVSQARRGILKNKHEGPLIKGQSRLGEIASDEMSTQSGFALPIGFLTTEKGLQADLAVMSPSILALEENCDDDDLSTSPVKIQHNTSKHVDDNSVISHTEDISLRSKKIVDKRRPSVRETTPWLASILGQSTKKPSGLDRQFSRR